MVSNDSTDKSVSDQTDFLEKRGYCEEGFIPNMRFCVIMCNEIFDYHQKWTVFSEKLYIVSKVTCF